MFCLFQRAVLHLKYSKNSAILIRIYKNCEIEDLTNSMKSFDVVVDFYNNANLTDEDEGSKENLLVESTLKENNLEQNSSILRRFSQKYQV